MAVIEGIGRALDTAAEGAGRLAEAARAITLDSRVRLGVTGLARAGKTVFVTSLVSHLLAPGRMHALSAAAEGRLMAAWLDPQPDVTLPRFPWEDHLAALAADPPCWPESTRGISELTVSLRLRPRGALAALTGERRVHIDIVDYPGEWLLDLALLEQDFEGWSAESLARLDSPARAEPARAFRELLAGIDPTAPHDEAVARALAEGWRAHLAACRARGLVPDAPGRALLPGDLAGSPALDFAPLPPGPAPRGSLAREFRRRFRAYRDRVALPFFRRHFSRIDRQVVLIDVLDALAAGPAALDDLRRTLGRVMRAFRPGRRSALARLLGLSRVERILFAATRADHLFHTDHPRLAALTAALVEEARQRAGFRGAETHALALAAIRATVEETRRLEGREVGLVRGTAPTGRQILFHPGPLPEDPAALLAEARNRAALWRAGGYRSVRFRPPQPLMRPGEGPAHIRLDAAAQFLFGDHL